MERSVEISLRFLSRASLVFLIIMFSAESFAQFSQTDKKYIRKGNREYNRGNFSDSEIMYRKASDGDTRPPEATFNIGDALYRQNKFEDAGRQFADNTTQIVDAEKQAAAWYNLGNSLLQANKIKESIEAYKNSLKLTPENKDAKYNLGYAQNLLREQEQQNQNNEQQQQNSEQERKNENPQSQPQDQQQQGQEKEQEQGISKEDAERLLNALANDEKAIQEKVKREKAAKARTRTLKNW